MSKEPEIVTRFRKLLDATSEDDLTAMAYNSPALHFALFMEIRDKNNRYIRPEPNVLQLRISEAIETLREHCPGLKIRLVGVKPRRAGLSTFSLHCGYHEAMRRQIEGLTIADCKKNSEMLMERLKDFTSHDSFPWDVRLVRDSTHSYAWSNGSTWTIDTAENPDAGVGGTRQFGHFSECSKYPKTEKKNDRKTMTAALPAFNGDDTTCIAESTPEGADGWFYDTFDEADWLEDFIAKWDAGFRPEQAWIRVFAAWHEFADYRRKELVSASERQQIDDMLTEDERDGIEKYGWDYEQLAWRRDTIAAECDNNPKTFAFYYPSNPVDCWLASGSPRFDMETLVKWEMTAQGLHIDRGYLVKQDDGAVTWHRQRDGTGDVEIFEPPRLGLKYGITIDPAESLSQTVGKDPDAHSVLVWRGGYFDTAFDVWRPLKLVARVRAPFRGEEDEVASYGERLSKFYGRCIVAQEVNKGFHIMRCLEILKIPLYRREPLSARTGKVEKQIGFKMTDHGNREALISSLASAIKNGDIEIGCLHVIGEMKTFIHGPKGKSQAALGKHDDDVISAAIAWEIIPTSATEYRVHKAKHVDPPDRQKGGWRQTNAGSRGW